MGKTTFEVDKEADVAYFTVGTGEPSYCEEFNDDVLVERGMYSKLVTGLRILNFSKFRKGHIRFNRIGIKRVLLLEKTALAMIPNQKPRRELLDNLIRSVEKELVT